MAFSLLTIFGWGIPALALSPQDLFPFLCARFEQVPFPNLTHTPQPGHAGLPHLLLTGSACLLGTQPSPAFLGCRKGETRRLEWLTKKTKGLCMFFTLTLHGGCSPPPGCPKASNPKRGGSLQSQTCCFQSNAASWFMSFFFKHPTPKSSKIKSVVLKDRSFQHLNFVWTVEKLRWDLDTNLQLIN